MIGFIDRIAGIFRPKPEGDAEQPWTPPGFLHRPDVNQLPEATDAHRIVKQICEEAVAAANGGWSIKLSDSPRWLALKDEDENVQIAVMMAAVDRRPHGSVSYSGTAWQVEELRKTVVSQVLRRNLAFTSLHLGELLEAWMSQPYSLEYGLPGRAMLGAVERLAKIEALDSHLCKTLARLRAKATHPSYPGAQPNKFHLQVADRIDRLLDPSKAKQPSLPAGPFADAFAAECAALAEAPRNAWIELGQLCAQAGDKAKPSAKWLDAAQAILTSIDDDERAARISAMMDRTTPDPTRPDVSLDILKGFVWLTPRLRQGDIAGQVGRFAEKCFRKIPGVGARSVKLGNAALWALSDMALEPRAAAELFRLREKIKYPSARKLIEARLGELADKAGQSVEAMEDLSLPTFGLDESSAARFEFGGSQAEIKVEAGSTDTSWFNGLGKSVKSPPTEVRTDYGVELTTFRQMAKDIEAARAAQVLRLEQSWVEGRDWTWAEWKTNFLDHPLRRPIVTGLLWFVDGHIVLPQGGTLADVGGKAVALAENARISLWHPLDSRPEQVLQWRQRILDLGIVQPIKQAHREIYVLTDAERQTRTYSNRFAAHILRQHQFRALCQARGWKYDLMGGWDNWNMPTRDLPKQDMSVQYHVEVVDDGQHSDSYVALHLASDQVRFLGRDGQPIELESISPIVFSEVLRDVDLFVAVASVANDPGWTDGGPDGRYGGYWREWAFGDLGQSATTRRELISWLVPKLSIAGKLEVTDKYLVVQGKRQKYAIHFGSSNIQILPDNRYLCIVPDRTPSEATTIKLPFSGDGLISTILAKAFLLVDENKIRDVTILNQL